MHKYLKSLLIGVLCLATQAFLLLYLNYSLVQREQMYISNSLYTTWNVILSDEDTPQSVKERLPDNTRLFLEHNQEGTIRTFIQQDNWTPPMVSGEFFSANSEQLQAVVGSHVKDAQKNNQLVLGNESYQIIGVTGTDFPSVLDHMILLSHMPSDVPTYRMIIDGDIPYQVESAIDLFQVHTQNEDHSISRFFTSDLFTQLLTLNIYLIVGLLTVVIGYLYATLYRNNDKVLHLIGETKRFILRANIIRFIVLFVCALGILFLIQGQIVIANLVIFLLTLVGIIVTYCISFYFSNKEWERVA